MIAKIVSKLSTPPITPAVKPAAKPVAPAALPPARYTVRLHFAEPDDLAAGKRVFSVALQGKNVLGNFDIAREAGASAKTLVREFPAVVIGNALSIRLTPSAGSTAAPVLCGVELVAEK